MVFEKSGKQKNKELQFPLTCETSGTRNAPGVFTVADIVDASSCNMGFPWEEETREVRMLLGFVWGKREKREKRREGNCTCSKLTYLLFVP